MNTRGDVGERPNAPASDVSRDSRGVASAFDDARLGWQLAIAGGPATWTRLLLMAVGAGLCVIVLLMAAAIGPALDARQERVAARSATSNQIVGPNGVSEQAGSDPSDPPVAGRFQAVPFDFTFDGKFISGVALASLAGTAAAPG